MRIIGRLALSILVLAATAARTRAADEASDDIVQLVVGLIGEKDKDLRAVGLEQVRNEAKGQAATKAFAAQLARLPADAQVSLLWALADRGDSAARPAVVELFTATKDPAVKVAGIGALGALGNAEDLRLLVPLAVSADKAERAAARSALVRLKGDDVPAGVVAQIKAAPTPVRVALIEALATRRALGTIPDLLELSLDVDAAVRTPAMGALGQLAGPDQIPGMLTGVLKAEKGAERDAAEKAVMFVCGRIADPAKRAAPVLEAIAKLPAAERMALLPTLGRVGTPAALPVVESAISDADPERHELGLRALCNWPDASVAPRLIELVEKEPHENHRALALAALIRVAPLPDKRPDQERLALLEKAMTLCARPADRNLVLKRAAAIRTVETLRYVLPFVDQPAYAAQACETVVELAHHRTLREPNKAEFDRALDKVLATSQDPVVKERADRYKKNQTWAKPKPAEGA